MPGRTHLAAKSVPWAGGSSPAPRVRGRPLLLHGRRRQRTLSSAAAERRRHHLRARGRAGRGHRVLRLPVPVLRRVRPHPRDPAPGVRGPGPVRLPVLPARTTTSTPRSPRRRRTRPSCRASSGRCRTSSTSIRRSGRSRPTLARTSIPTRRASGWTWTGSTPTWTPRPRSTSSRRQAEEGTKAGVTPHAVVRDQRLGRAAAQPRRVQKLIEEAVRRRAGTVSGGGSSCRGEPRGRGRSCGSSWGRPTPASSSPCT